MGLRVWLRAVRPAFLPASLIPVLVGLAYTWSTTHTLSPLYAAVTLTGIALAHISADLFNDYFDYVHGTDQISKMRGLSGGTGVLVDGLLEPKQVFRGGFLTMGLALLCGLYLTVQTGPVVLLLMGLGALSIYAYTSLLQRVGLGEATLALERVATVLGTYYVQTKRLAVQPALLGLILGVLSIYMVYCAAFPDYEADSATGKRTLVVLLGPQRAITLAPTAPLLAYALQAALVVVGLLPATTLATVFVAPLGYLSLRSLRRGEVGPSLKYTALFTRLHGAILAASLVL